MNKRSGFKRYRARVNAQVKQIAHSESRFHENYRQASCCGLTVKFWWPKIKTTVIVKRRKNTVSPCHPIVQPI